MTEEMQDVVFKYLEQIDRKLDVLMRELVEFRTAERIEEAADLSIERSRKLGDLIDRFAALSPEQQRADVEKANEFLRQRMAEQPGASFMELDLSERPKH